MAKGKEKVADNAGDGELPLTKVRAIRDGYCIPYGETRMRRVVAGEEFLHEGTLGKWMVDLSDAKALAAIPKAKLDIPNAIKRAMGRASSHADTRAKEAEDAMQAFEERAALNRKKIADERQAGKDALAGEKKD